MIISNIFRRIPVGEPKHSIGRTIYCSTRRRIALQTDCVSTLFCKRRPDARNVRSVICVGAIIKVSIELVKRGQEYT